MTAHEKTLREQILAGDILQHLDFHKLTRAREREHWIAENISTETLAQAKKEMLAESKAVQADPEMEPDDRGASDASCSELSVPVFDIAAMRRELERMKGRGGRDSKEFWQRKIDHIERTGGNRLLAQAPDDWGVQIDSLRDKCPNFDAVIDHLQDEFSFAALGERGVPMIAPILLVGPAGVGKSMFAETLSQLLAGGMVRQSMENSQGGFDLAGSASHWSTTAPGKIFNVLVDGPYANPLIFCDELDKVSASDHGYDPYAPLYGLLESDTARHWQDQSVVVDMDTTHLRWVFTANAIAPIPEPIMSRLQVFEIAAPTPEQLRGIALNIFQSLKAQVKQSAAIKDAYFDDLELSEAGLSMLQELAPRTIKLALRRGMARAMTRIKAGNVAHIAVLPGDLTTKTSSQPAKMGFI